MNDQPIPEGMSSEQWAFLKQFAENYVTGRKLMCWIARGVVGLGALAAATAGIVALVQQLLAMRGQ
jgi:hypothetical protein